MHIQGASSIHGPQAVNAPHGRVANATSAPASTPRSADEVNISSAAQAADLVNLVRQLPDVRADRVAELRQQIAAGGYDSEERISAALERFLDEVG